MHIVKLPHAAPARSGKWSCCTNRWSTIYDALKASGVRLMTTLLHTLEDNGGRLGLQTMCEGGGQANATIVELL